jgi:hypothetical protein
MKDTMADQSECSAGALFGHCRQAEHPAQAHRKYFPNDFNVAEVSLTATPSSNKPRSSS